MNTAAAMRASLGVPSVDPTTMLASPDNDNIWGFCVSIFCLGALAGCSLGASLSDQLGRRKMLLGSSVVYGLGGVLEASASLLGPLGGVSLLLAGRVVTGVACGATTVVVPMYLGEISPPHLRGALGTCFQLCCVVAMLVAQVLGLLTVMYPLPAGLPRADGHRGPLAFLPPALPPYLSQWCTPSRCSASPR